MAAEGFFAVELEDLGDMPPEAVLQQLVGIPKRHVKTRGESPANCAFARAHHSEKNDACHALIESMYRNGSARFGSGGRIRKKAVES